MTAKLDPAKMRLLRTVTRDGVGFWCAALDAGSKRVYAGGTDFDIHIYDLPAIEPAKVSPLKGHTSYVTSLVYLPGMQTLISGGFDKQLLWWKPDGGTKPLAKVSLAGRVNCLAASADGSLLAVVTNELTGHVLDARTGKLRVELRNGHPPTTFLGRQNTLYSIAMSPDGKRAATGDRAGTIAFWDTASGKQQGEAKGAAFYSQAFSQEKLASEYEWGGVRSLAFTPDGKMLIAGGMGPADQNSAGIDGPMRLEAFDAATGKSLAVFMAAPKGILNSMLIHPDSGWLIAGGGGGQAGSAGIGSLWLWNYRLIDKDRKLVAPVMHQSQPVVRGLVLNREGDQLLTVGMQRDLTAGRIEVWDLTGKATPPAPVKPMKK